MWLQRPAVAAPSEIPNPREVNFILPILQVVAEEFTRISDTFCRLLTRLYWTESLILTPRLHSEQLRLPVLWQKDTSLASKSSVFTLCILGITSTLSIWLTSPGWAEVAPVIPNTSCAIFCSRTGELQQTICPPGPAVTSFEKKTEMMEPLWPLTLFLTWLTRSVWLEGLINLMTMFKLQDRMINFSRGYCYI